MKRSTHVKKNLVSAADRAQPAFSDDVELSPVARDEREMLTQSSSGHTKETE